MRQKFPKGNTSLRKLRPLDSMNPLIACVAVQGSGAPEGLAPLALNPTLTQTLLE